MAFGGHAHFCTLETRGALGVGAFCVPDAGAPSLAARCVRCRTLDARVPPQFRASQMGSRAFSYRKSEFASTRHFRSTLTCAFMSQRERYTSPSLESIRKSSTSFFQGSLRCSTRRSLRLTEVQNAEGRDFQRPVKVEPGVSARLGVRIVLGRGCVLPGIGLGAHVCPGCGLFAIVLRTCVG